MLLFIGKNDPRLRNKRKKLLGILLDFGRGHCLKWSGKETARQEGDAGSIPGSRRSPGEGNGNPLPYSCLEKSHRQRSAVSYSPKESDTT